MENIEKENIKCLAGAVDFKDDKDEGYQEKDDNMRAQMDEILHQIATIDVENNEVNEITVKKNLRIVVEILIPRLKSWVILKIEELMDDFYLALSKLYTGMVSKAMFENYEVDIAGKKTPLSEWANVFCLTNQTVKITLYKDSDMKIMEALKKQISSSPGLEPMICDGGSMVVHAPACMSTDYIQCAVDFVKSHLKRLEKGIREAGKEACNKLKEAAKNLLLAMDENDLISEFQITKLIEENVELGKKIGEEMIGSLTKSL